MIKPSHQLSVYSEKFQNNLIIVLKVVCVCVFAGRAWQHLIWDAPYRTLLWNQQLLGNVIPWITGMSWEEYAGSTTVDNSIQLSIRISGVIYFLSAIAVIFINGARLWLRLILIPGIVLLGILQVGSIQMRQLSKG